MGPLRRFLELFSSVLWYSTPQTLTSSASVTNISISLAQLLFGFTHPMQQPIICLQAESWSNTGLMSFVSLLSGITVLYTYCLISDKLIVVYGRKTNVVLVTPSCSQVSRRCFTNTSILSQVVMIAAFVKGYGTLKHWRFFSLAKSWTLSIYSS